MNNRKKIMWGIALLLIAAAVIVFAINPSLAVFAAIPLWKAIVALVLIYWIVENVLFGKKLVDHFDIFIPVAIGLLVFEREIAIAIGKKSGDIYSNWLIIVAAILFTIAIHLIFDTHSKANYTASGSVPPSMGSRHANRFSSHAFYIDATTKDVITIDNSFGATEAFFQNVEQANDQPLTININNKFGGIEVHVPQNWRVDNQASSSFGAIEIHQNPDVFSKKIIVTGTNSFGGVEFKY